ncbi:hypothetical protein B0H14DRAFT_3478715 [Mycena olivaceomarginata]|nr:hypothetical protein B0H14DRAFT_3478715 [Mycena olivaceomarginata]
MCVVALHDDAAFSSMIILALRAHASRASSTPSRARPKVAPCAFAARAIVAMEYLTEMPTAGWQLAGRWCEKCKCLSTPVVSSLMARF